MEQRPKWHSHCAEIACIDKALKNGHSVNGTEMRAVNIGSSGKGHRTPKKPCITCSTVAKELGINIK